MPTTITIAQADTTIQQAERHGFYARTVWDHPANAALKELRSDMNALQPGDQLVIPDKRITSVMKASGARHRFKRHGIPAKFVLQLLENSEPRASQQYRLIVEDRLFKGTTDAHGVLSEYIPAQAKEGTLYIGPENLKITLQFGDMDPVEELSGVQKRLHNLGYDPGPAEGQWTPETSEAIRQFQAQFGLEQTGEVDKPTRDKLDELYGKIGKLPSARNEANAGGLYVSSMKERSPS